MPKSVLIADDNTSIRYLIRSLVESAGFHVCGEAADGREAIEKAKQFSPDLILLDLSMPNMNGAEAAAFLKKNMPHVPIILFTMHEESLRGTLAGQLGVDRVIGKPEGMNKLVDSMRELLGLATPDSQAVGPLKIPAAGGLSEIPTTPPVKPTEEKPPQ